MLVANIIEERNLNMEVRPKPVVMGTCEAWPQTFHSQMGILFWSCFELKFGPGKDNTYTWFDKTVSKEHICMLDVVVEKMPIHNPKKKLGGKSHCQMYVRP